MAIITMTLFVNIDILLKNSVALPESLVFLDTLCFARQCSVVIMSDVAEYSQQQILEILTPLGKKNISVTGYIDISKNDIKPAIHLYMRDHNITNYLIIDSNEPPDSEYQNHLVKIDELRGFNFDAYQAALCMGANIDI